MKLWVLQIQKSYNILIYCFQIIQIYFLLFDNFLKFTKMIKINKFNLR